MNENNNQEKSTNKNLIATVGCFAAVILVAGIFLWPKFQQLQTAWEKIEDKKQEIQDRKNYLSKLDQLKTELERNKDEIDKINTSLPDYPSLSSVFHYLQKTSSESGLIFEEVAPFTTIPSKSFPRIRETVFNIKVVGSYDSLKNFISTFEDSSRLIKVENIYFSMPEEKEKGEGKKPFSFDLKLKTYSY